MPKHECIYILMLYHDRTPVELPEWPGQPAAGSGRAAAVGPATSAGAAAGRFRRSGWLAYTAAVDDDAFMEQALVLARAAAAEGEIPVGALVVHQPPGAAPRIIGRGCNRREADRDPTAHAEIVALREAGRALGAWRLADCTLYVTLEPCPMCAGAVVNARLPRLVYGCADPKAGAVATLYHLCTDGRLNHRLTVVGGVQAAAAGQLLRAFFARRRQPGTCPDPESG